MVTIYHNPRCSKSRQTLALMQDRDITPEIIEYLKTPPNKSQLKKILGLLNVKPRDLMRTKEPAYKDNNLGDPALSDDALITAMVENPVLIERPVVVANGKAAVGRPPEAVLEIL